MLAEQSHCSSLAAVTDNVNGTAFQFLSQPSHLKPHVAITSYGVVWFQSVCPSSRSINCHISSCLPGSVLISLG